jgi:hypothetical protein
MEILRAKTEEIKGTIEAKKAKWPAKFIMPENRMNEAGKYLLAQNTNSNNQLKFTFAASFGQAEKFHEEEMKILNERVDKNFENNWEYNLKTLRRYEKTIGLSVCKKIAKDEV